jgi:alpha-beta hydrolase superfamily lysophospholipase
MPGGDRSVYRELAGRLVERGISVLTLDVRGHGASLSSELPGEQAFVDGMPASFSGAVDDVMAALAFLGQHLRVDGERIGVVGAGLGGLWATLGADDEDGVIAIGLLSPGLQIEYARTLAGHADRATLLVVSSDDAVATRSAEQLTALLGEERTQVLTYDGAGFGTDMLDNAAELEPALVRWLGDVLAGQTRL